ncbi:hypothetical protein EV188_103331 [Actinomycetospora succinea]|uniref:Uncharacterized protein n=1 Tax=Actinomycetospora succinea TaxID=663603 RepID=A0A4R6VEA4_9PSEU|nr:hypothetical protein [Actinomycetospora succinea]TDQ60829.1 hypothetical protein EV188_103331 [Actinomycetospora succinea]
MATPTADPSIDQVRERAVDMLTQVQEAGLRFAGSVAESWTAALQNVPGAGAVTGKGAAAGVPGLPRTPFEAVDRFYDTGVQILEAQRSVAHQVLEAVAPALPTSVRATSTPRR